LFFITIPNALLFSLHRSRRKACRSCMRPNHRTRMYPWTTMMKRTTTKMTWRRSWNRTWGLSHSPTYSQIHVTRRFHLYHHYCSTLVSPYTVGIVSSPPPSPLSQCHRQHDSSSCLGRQYPLIAFAWMIEGPLSSYKALYQDSDSTTFLWCVAPGRCRPISTAFTFIFTRNLGGTLAPLLQHRARLAPQNRHIYSSERVLGLLEECARHGRPSRRLG